MSYSKFHSFYSIEDPRYEKQYQGSKIRTQCLNLQYCCWSEQAAVVLDEPAETSEQFVDLGEVQLRVKPLTQVLQYVVHEQH